MIFFLRFFLYIFIFLIFGCGGGENNNKKTMGDFYPLIYQGNQNLAELNAINIPIVLDYLDTSFIEEFVSVYHTFPYEDILTSNTNFNKTIKGKIGGKQILAINIINKTQLELVQQFDNYSEDGTVINGKIKNIVSTQPYSSDIALENLNFKEFKSDVIISGKINYKSSRKESPLVLDFTASNNITNEMVLYKGFSTQKLWEKSISSYNGIICDSSYGCVDINSSIKMYNEKPLQISGKNIATLLKDFNNKILANIDNDNDQKRDRYIVFDQNITQNPFPLLDLNISSKSQVYFDEQKQLRQNSGGGLSIGDLDKNGKKDLVFISKASSLFIDDYLNIVFNVADETNKKVVTYPVDLGTYSNAITILNINSDSKDDILVKNYHDMGEFIQQDDLNFTSALHNRYQGNLQYDAILDFDNDGKDDMIRIRRCSLSIYTNYKDITQYIDFPLNNCSSNATYNTKLSMGDFNNDQKNDLLVTHKSDKTGIFFFTITNNGDGIFTENEPSATKTSYINTIVGDINADGYDDIIINDTIFVNQKNNLFHKMNNLNFRAFGSENLLTIKDINSDGINDLIYKDINDIRASLIYEDFSSEDMRIERGERDESSYSYSLIIDDINNDGKLEFIKNYNNKIEFIYFK